jgi:hypothetical protein
MPARPLSILPLALSLLVLATAPARAVPAPPTERADRFGVYYWGADSSAWPGSPDRLRWGADKVAEIGSRTIRVSLGPADSYDVNPRITPDVLYLQRIAASPAYDALFRDPRFRTYLITVFTSTGSQTPFKAVRNQIARLGEHLLGEPAYAGKTFILLNWEGDNAIGVEPPGSPEWDRLILRTEARADGVRDARERRPQSSARLYSGLEFNFVARDGVRCGEGEVRCVIDMAAPRVSVDYYSYSAWQSLDVSRQRPGAALAGTMQADLEFALRKVRQQRPEIREENFLVGEIGFARSIYSECVAARHLEDLVRSFERPGAFRASYIVYWQALDNGWRGGRRTPCVGDLRDEGDPEGQIDWLLHGLFRGRDARMTLPGKALQALLRGQTPPPTPPCPSIDPQGVADSFEGGSPFLHPGGPVTISGRGFTRRGGNRVLILQAHDRNREDPNVLLELRGSADDAGWSESPERITATLPKEGLHDGCALVWVTTRDGVESNAQLVRIRPE